MDKNPNESIQCTVNQCRFHCMDQNYCSLQRIMVGTHEPNPTVQECTDCQSFQIR